MLNDDFFSKLEREIIPNALEEISIPGTNGFWCDSVTTIASDLYYTKKFINDNKYVSLLAYIGKDGQTKYEVILYFGPKALSRYARDLPIVECIPDTNASEWFTIDVQKQKIEIQLL
jgi:hypothetical protein